MDTTLRLIIEAALAVLLFCTMLAIIYSARRSVVKPLPKPDGSEIFCVIAASGSALQLEQTVRGLLWLNDCGEVINRVVIADCGLDEHAKRLAGLLSGDFTRVMLCKPGDLPMILEENGWTEGGNT